MKLMAATADEFVAVRILDMARRAGDAGKADSSRRSPLLMEDDGKYMNTTASCTIKASANANRMTQRALPSIVSRSAVTLVCCRI